MYNKPRQIKGVTHSHKD